MINADCYELLFNWVGRRGWRQTGSYNRRNHAVVRGTWQLRQKQLEITIPAIRGKPFIGTKPLQKVLIGVEYNQVV